MKQTAPHTLLSRELLCFVRDARPTVKEFVARFGGAHGQVYHVLRKAGVIRVAQGRVALDSNRLSEDGQAFLWGNQVIRLDRDEVWLVSAR